MTRPSFSAAWAASMQIYDPANSATKVAQVIGGKVAANILPLGQRGKWANTCAVRMSYILNRAGVLIPHVPGKPYQALITAGTFTTSRMSSNFSPNDGESPT